LLLIILEHIDRVKNQNEEVNHYLDEGKETLGKINGFWSRLGDKLRRKKKDTKKKEEKVKSPIVEKKEEPVVGSQTQTTTERTIPETQAPAAINPYHDEVDNELEEIHSMVKGLKQMAIDAGGEINRQSQKIDEMGDRVENNQNKLHVNLRKIKL
jgi:curved DNA-binding protein CbpA